VLAASDALRIASYWEVTGTRIATRRDGLVSQATWLCDLARHGVPRPDIARPDIVRHDSATPAEAASRGCGFALLLDFFPATAGKRTAAFAPGQRFAAELVFYPGRHPLRAVLQSSANGGPPPLPTSSVPDDDAAVDALAAHRRHLAAVPWAQVTPLRLGPGALLRDGRGQLWWSAQDRNAATPPLRVAALDDEALWLGAPLQGALALWDGFQADLLRVWTPLGAADPNG
jgi:hypothetical protein